MNIESKVSGHWTDEQLIAHLYGVGPNDGHVEECRDCQVRLIAMQSQRQAAERASSSEDVSFEFLAAQRRRIYEKITVPTPGWWPAMQVRRWVAGTAGLLVVAGGLLLIENRGRPPVASNNISDAQLAQDVSRMAEDPEPPATAPLQALFEE